MCRYTNKVDFDLYWLCSEWRYCSLNMDFCLLVDVILTAFGRYLFHTLCSSII